MPIRLCAAHALEAVAAVVAVALDAPGRAAARRRRGRCGRRGSRSRRATRGPGAEVDLDRDVADQPRARLAHRLQVGEAEPGQLLLAELVAVAEQLVAAADGEQRRRRPRPPRRAPRAWSRPCRRRPCAGRGPGRRRCRRGRGRRGRPRSPGPGAGVGEADPAPLAAPLQEEDVAAVGVDVHLLRVEGEDAQLHQAPLLEHDDGRADVDVGGRRSRGARPAPARPPRASRLELRRRGACASRISFGSSLSSPSGRRSGAGGGSTISPSPMRRRRAAGSSRPSRRPRARRAAAARAVGLGGSSLDDRQRRTGRPGAGARRRSAGSATRSVGAVEQLQRAASAPATRANVAAEVEARGRRRRPPRPAGPSARSAQRRDQLRVEVERRSPRARGGRGAGRRGRCRSRGRAPGRRPRRASSSQSAQVGGVGAALDVVPDRRLPRPRSSPELLRQAAVGEQLAQLQQGGVGGQGEEPARRRRRRRGRARPRSPARPRSRSAGQPAYLSRSAISGARVPAQTTRRTAPAEQLEVGVPDPGDVAAVGDPVVERDPEVDPARSPASSRSVRSTSLAPAGFLISRIETGAAADLDRLDPAEGGPHLAQRGGDPLRRDPEPQRRRRPRRARCRRCRGRGAGSSSSISPGGRAHRRRASRPCRAARSRSRRRRAAAARRRSWGRSSGRGGRRRRARRRRGGRSGGSAWRRRRAAARAAPGEASSIPK